MAVMSPPIAVAAATPIRVEFANVAPSANIQYRFYSDAAGTVAIAPGTGTRDLSLFHDASAFEGSFSSPGQTLPFDDSSLENGTIVDAVDGMIYEADFGAGLSSITITAAAKTTPGSAVVYRVVVSPAVAVTL